MITNKSERKYSSFNNCDYNIGFKPETTFKQPRNVKYSIAVIMDSKGTCMFYYQHGTEFRFFGKDFKNIKKTENKDDNLD